MKFWCFLVCASVQAQIIVQLRPETTREYEGYQAMVDRELKERLRGPRPFLWIDERSEDKRRAEAGEIVTHSFTGTNGRGVTDGLVHDWVATMYVPGVKLETVRTFILDTEHHVGIYPDLKESRVVSQIPGGNITKLRLVKKKVLTAVLDIEYENHWEQPAPGRWIMNARSRNVTEVENGQNLPPGTGHGFLWAMNSQWSLREEPGGVWVELRSVSLSRDTPKAVGWLVKPMIRNFPAEAILSTMQATRSGVAGRLRVGQRSRTKQDQSGVPHAAWPA